MSSSPSVWCEYSPVLSPHYLSDELTTPLPPSVAGFGIARTYYLWEINNNYDTSWIGFQLFVWSLLECHFAIIFACAPSLRAFVRRYLGDSISRTFGSSSRSRTRSNGNVNIKGQVVASNGQDGSTMRQSGIPLDSWPKKPAQVQVQPHVAPKPSKDTLDGYGANFYHEESSPPSSSVSQHHTNNSPGNDDQQPIRSASEYEAYAMRQLSRHAYNRSGGATQGSESAGHDWNDPRRRWEADNAV